MDYELKPCPFCGGELIGQPDLFSGGLRYDHNCINDLLGSCDFIPQWNKRPIEEKLNKRIDELEKELETWKRNYEVIHSVVQDVY